jgi:glycosyltransferase involved in cell wall biosynthesis
VRLLIHTRFHPSVGGVETVADLLVREWIASGESVTVVTDVAFDPSRPEHFDFPVVHRPSFLQWLRLLRNHDLFVHFNISLRALWPLIFVRRPFVAVHHGFYIVDRSGRRDWREKFKLWVARRATRNIAVSEAIAAEVSVPCTVIPDPFDASCFNFDLKLPRTRDLIFVGRLVSDKGVEVLFRALANLRDDGFEPQLTVVGDGPERPRLLTVARDLRIERQVLFAGSRTQGEVADHMRAHSVLVIPSVIREGFGVVALEAIASGCVVIGANAGGLPEAIGRCGVTFSSGDPRELAHCIKELLTNGERRQELRKHAIIHLDRHRPRHVAARYLEVMKEALCVS